MRTTRVSESRSPLKKIGLFLALPIAAVVVVGLIVFFAGAFDSTLAEDDGAGKLAASSLTSGHPDRVSLGQGILSFPNGGLSVPDGPLSQGAPHHFVLDRHDVSDRLGPVGAVVFAGHLHEVERDVFLEQHLCELTRGPDQSVLRPAVEIDVGELISRHLLNQREGIERVRVFRGHELAAGWISLYLAAESFNADTRIGSTATLLPLGLFFGRA